MGRMGDWIVKLIDISLMICIYIYEDIYRWMSKVVIRVGGCGGGSGIGGRKIKLK